MPMEDRQTEVGVNQQQTTMMASAVGGAAVCLVLQGKSPKGNRGISGTSKDSYVKERFQTEQEKTCKLQRYEFRP
jgi:hypothetical protein